MKKFLDGIAWILVLAVGLLVIAAVAWGAWEMLKWFFGTRTWEYAALLAAWFMVIRVLRWAFCRVTKDPVPFWSSMGFFE